MNHQWPTNHNWGRFKSRKEGDACVFSLTIAVTHTADCSTLQTELEKASIIHDGCVLNKARLAGSFKKALLHSSLYNIIIHQNKQFRVGKTKLKPLCTHASTSDHWKTDGSWKPPHSEKKEEIIQVSVFKTIPLLLTIPAKSGFRAPPLTFAGASHELKTSFRATFVKNSILASTCSTSSHWDW